MKRHRGTPPPVARRGRAEQLLPGVPVGPPIDWTPPAVLPPGVVGAQPWGLLPAKPPLQKARK